MAEDVPPRLKRAAAGWVRSRGRLSAELARLWDRGALGSRAQHDFPEDLSGLEQLVRLAASLQRKHTVDHGSQAAQGGLIQDGGERLARAEGDAEDGELTCKDQRQVGGRPSTRRSATRHDPAMGEGRVLVQEPQTGARTKGGRTLRVIESMGPERASVPELTGGSLRRAQIALSARGLHVATSARLPVDGVAAGHVVAQDPPQGSEQWPGAGASLLMSSGPRPRVYVMPDLTGRSMETVRRWVSRAGLRLGRVSLVVSRDAAPGSVLAQRPLPGYPLDPSVAITLSAADGGTRE